VIDEDHEQRNAAQRIHAGIAWQAPLTDRGCHRFGHAALFGVAAERGK
jgi:hypothetical protein